MLKERSVDKTSAARTRAGLDALLDALREQGMAVRIGKGRYTDTQITFHVTIAKERSDGVVMTKEAGNFVRLANALGMSPDWLGKEFSHGRDRYRVVGYNSSCRKFPVQGERVTDGRRYKFTVEGLRRAMVMTTQQGAL